jgi:arginine N-succinyltransferase
LGVFIIRRAKVEDVETLVKLARMVHFINLPADRDIIHEKVRWSTACFDRAAVGGPPTARSRGAGAGAGGVGGGKADGQNGRASATRALEGLRGVTRESDLFLFVMEDTDSGGLVGTSQLIAKMGGPGRPNLSFELSRREMFSHALQIGTTHTIARLRLDESGPTEVGGLILQPAFRGHKMRLGRFLSLIRFHFIGLERRFFSSRLLAEMAGTLNPDGRNMFWEYLGRRFINLPYEEADKFCQYSREFMLSLLPREDIYLTLLPPEATFVVGEVGPETLPARRMLERLGFQYRSRVDPFDGGPHLEAETDNIDLVRDSRRLPLGEPIAAAACRESGFVSVLRKDGEFRAIEARFTIDKGQKLRLPREHFNTLAAEPGMVAGVTPIREPARPAAAEASEPARPQRKKRPSKAGSGR